MKQFTTRLPRGSHFVRQLDDGKLYTNGTTMSIKFSNGMCYNWIKHST